MGEIFEVTERWYLTDVWYSNDSDLAMISASGK